MGDGFKVGDLTRMCNAYYSSPTNQTFGTLGIILKVLDPIRENERGNFQKFLWYSTNYMKTYTFCRCDLEYLPAKEKKVKPRDDNV